MSSSSYRKSVKQVLTLILILLVCFTFLLPVGVFSEEVSNDNKVNGTVSDVSVKDADKDTNKDAHTKDAHTDVETPPESSDGINSNDSNLLHVSKSTDPAVKLTKETTLTKALRVKREAAENLMSTEAPSLSSTAPSTFPIGADGNQIENVRVSWVTPDSPADDGIPSTLSQKWTDNIPQTVRMKIDFSLSGQHDYEPGTISFVVPKNIFKDRNGNFTGRMNLAVPEAPDSNGTFVYTEEGNKYIIINNKKLSSATTAVIEFTISGLVPSEIRDLSTGYVTDKFGTSMKLVTSAGTVLTAQSNEIDAKIDTAAILQEAGNKATVNRPRETWSNKFPTELKPENHKDYVYVAYTTYVKTKANQYFDLKWEDTISSNGKSKTGTILGYKIADSQKVIKTSNGATVRDDNFFS